MPNYTDSQKRAIKDGAPKHKDGQTQLGHNVLVSASAGSGKTSVLVQRVLSQILDDGDISHLLVVTFTKAAAAEMKSRIQDALKDQLTPEKATKLTAHQQRHLASQIGLVNSAAISTLDAFALQIVQQYYYILDLDPGFRVLADQTESTLIQEDVWDKLREKYYANDTDGSFTALTDNFANGWHDDKLGDIVTKIYTYAQTTPNPEAWIDQFTNVYDGDLSANGALTKQLRAAMQDPVADMVKNYTTASQMLVEEQTEMAADGNESAAATLITNELAKAKALQDALSGNYTQMHDAAMTMNYEGQHWITWPSLRQKKYKNVPELMDAHALAKNLRDDAHSNIFDKQVMPLLKLANDDLLKATQGAKKLTDKLSEVAKAFLDAYWAEKRRRHALDFSDIEHLALDILTAPSQEDKPNVAAIYQDSFDEILVDEYQDINELQETLLNALTAKPVGNRFMVGDVKQSIYGFRLAQPRLFMNKYNTFAPATASAAEFTAKGEHISLAENFRSTSDVLDFTNLIFRQIMDSQLGSVNYTGAEPLVLGAKDYPDDFHPETELLIYTPKDAEDESEAAQMDKDLGQVNIVIQRIHELMRSDTKLYNRKTHEMRPLQYKDITLLVPTRGQNLIIQEQFNRAGIPIMVTDAQNYFKTTELQVMLSMLRVIDNPRQDIPLAAVLRSPIVGLNADQLALIRLSQKHADYYDALTTFIANYDANTASNMAKPTYERVQRFMTQLTQFRNIARENQLVDLIWAIYEETGYLDFVGGMPGGKQRQANLHALYERAHSYEAGGFKGLFAFVHFIELMQDRDKDLATPVSVDPDTDAVRIMTIHGSKGLQFPVVFLMNASRTLDAAHDSNGTILSDTGVGMSWIDPDTNMKVELPQLQLAKQNQKASERAEDLRVLYVALTRAEQKLFVVGNTKTDQATTLDRWAKMSNGDTLRLPISARLTANSELDLIGASLIRHPLFPDRPAGVTSPAELAKDPTKFKVTFITQPVVPGEGKTPAGEQIKQPVLDVNLKDYFNFKYPYTAATETTGFKSVSEIKQLFADPDITELNQQNNGTLLGGKFSAPLADPQFVSGTSAQQASATAIGTATHTILQRLNLHQPVTEAAIDAVRDDLVTSGVLSEEVAGKVKTNHILNFFATELGKNMLAHPDAVHREEPFALLLPGNAIFEALEGDDQDILVHGIMDAYIQTPEQLILLDYKTDHIGKGGEEAIMSRYSGQLRLYARALAAATGRPVDASYLVLLESGHVLALSPETRYDK
ncbi:helicase-exonuclease AddAB subunit AddA [Lacticaseibacillus pabuli]|uniref:ATP-dependent helicase/nuclease subunit A n=1 Tax=Lacticaseibacillus pabuli TaxID=3025672 RepID=A0ABY7WMS4_9LACO|nr:helicase-exonuclease AddAB subunit AddA [Lacticaseibacillus sp. KACC 23028]WDF81512.1 helicase-exonuclease AddAB subunit AddA [Lacticaseibacillus sp. KACC 23028]